MAFGFSKTSTRTPVGGYATNKGSKSTPKSVQAIIDRATASMSAPGYGYSSGALPSAPPAITPQQQTQATTYNPMMGAVSPSLAPTASAGGSAPSAMSSTVGSGGGAASGAGGLPANGTDAYSGWMSRFNPSDFQNEVYNDPQIVLNAMFKDAGIGTESPSYSTLRSMNGADPMSLFLLTNGGQTSGNLTPEAYGNFLHSLYGNQMTPGGRTIDFNEAMANLRGAGSGANSDVSKQGALYQQLTRGGAPEQFRAYYGLAQDAAKMGLPPAIASAFLDALARQGDTYLSGASQSTGGNVPSFYNYASNPVMR